MGSVADRLDSMVVTVSSPDGQITATLSNGDQVTFGFRPGSYERYPERTLEFQLARLAASIWVGYQRGYRRALDDAAGAAVSTDGMVRGSKRDRFRQDQAQLVAEGTSTSGRIRASSQGLMHWRVTIASGAVRALTEDEFLAEVGEAARSLLANYYEQVRQLKDEYFGLDLPDRRR